MTCGEAARDPRTFAAFLLTMKEGERGGPSERRSGGEPAGDVAGASAGEGQQAAPFLPEPVPPSNEPDGFPTWLGLLAVAALGLALIALIAIVARSFFGGRQLASAPVGSGAVRRSI